MTHRTPLDHSLSGGWLRTVPQSGRRRCHWPFIVLICLVGQLQVPHQCSAQQGNAAGASASAQVMEVFTLKHVQGDEILQALNPLVGNMSLSVVPSRKALLAQGTRDEIEQLGQFLAKLDVPSQAESANHATVLVTLKNINALYASEMIANAFQTHAGFQNVTADTVGNSAVLVTADESCLAEVKEFIASLELQFADSIHSLRLYNLRNIPAETAYEVVASLLESRPGVRLAVDKQTNRLIVSGDAQTHQMVQEAVESIDVPLDTTQATTATQGEVIELRSLPLANPQEAELSRRAASLAEVQVEIIDELRLAVVKGTRENVHKYVAAHDALLAKAQQLREQSSATPTRAVAVRVVWMASSDEPAAETNADGLEKIRASAAKYGIGNLRKLGQFITPARIDLKQPSAFTLSGSVEWDDAHYEMQCTGSLLALSEAADSFALRVSVGGAQPASATPTTPLSAEVDLQLALNKPVIVAALPAGKQQAVFVIEIVEQRE